MRVPGGWPCLIEEMEQVSEKMSWLKFEGSCRWARPVDTVFLKLYVHFTGGRIQFRGAEWGLFPTGASEKWWPINLFWTLQPHHFKWLLLAVVVPFPKATSYFIAKAVQFWADICIFSNNEGYLKEMNMAESAVLFLAGCECELAGWDSV